MANPNPIPRFKPGQSGNPSGRPKSYLTKDDIKSTMGKFGKMTLGELKEKLKDPKTTLTEIAIGNIFIRAAEEGDHVKLNFLLEHQLGKLREEFSITNLDKTEEERRAIADELLSDPEAREAAKLIAERSAKRELKLLNSSTVGEDKPS